jgi:diguanylate cyclase (GGDEF)-like protein
MNYVSSHQGATPLSSHSFVSSSAPLSIPMAAPGSADILIVDDTLENLRMLSAILTQHGYRVRKAVDGEMALLAMQTLAPDLILLDIMLPKMDGYTLCKQIKASPDTASIPIIFLSALDGEFDKVKAFEAGGADYICKPFQIQEVLVRVRHQITLKTVEQEIRQLNAELEHRVSERTVQLEQANTQLTQLALYDGLTGLANRLLFTEALEKEVDRAALDPTSTFALLFLDGDRFKVINDSLGHAVGDELLVAIAQRLQSLIRPQDLLARLGGDEFAILLTEVMSPQQPQELAVQILKALSQPFHLSGREIYTSVSIGIALKTMPESQAAHLLRNADIAMYWAKTSGKNQYQVFETRMHTAAVRRLQLETDLYRAVANQEFLVHYQPILSLTTGRLAGFEALVRWQHPEQGLIYPGEFIPLAEETGLITQISYWILSQACGQLVQWQRQGIVEDQVTISVNLSGRQFMQTDLVDQVERILSETNLSPACLNLEITESVIIDNTRAAKVLHQLKSHQIKISIDDFGTGYSSLKYLHSLPIDVLKIDKSFVQGLDEKAEQINLVPIIINLANLIGIQVVAEGIETQSQVHQLQSLNCQFGQGFLFSKPVDQTQVPQLLREHLNCSKSLFGGIA